jgi:hypothetical protein
MANFFKDIAGGVEKVQSGFLGPTHNYMKDLKSPDEMGMSSEGTMEALAKDVTGIIAYTGVLVGGSCTNDETCGQKQMTPLGNKFFLKTGGQCKPSNGVPKDRWLYINNVPTGSIPFITPEGTSLKEFRGLVPGTIENLGHLNPLALFGGFMQGTTPPCRILDLPDKVGGPINTTKYVADADITNLSPCLWSKHKNPVSGTKGSGCASGFKNMNDIMAGIKRTFDGDTTQSKPVSKIYNAGFSILLVYLMYHLISKSGN